RERPHTPGGGGGRGTRRSRRGPRRSRPSSTSPSTRRGTPPIPTPPRSPGTYSAKIREMTEKNVVTAIHDALHEAMAADERLVVLGEDVGARGGVFRVTKGFLGECVDARGLA